MCDLLSRPWLVGSASRALLGEASAPELPKLVQLLECRPVTADGSLVLVISDKFNYCPATLSPEGAAGLVASLKDRPLPPDIDGALVRVEVAAWEIVSESGSGPSLRLAIERLLYVGGEGCGTHGDPCSLLTSGAIRQALARSVLDADDLMALGDGSSPPSDHKDVADWLVDDDIPASQQTALEQLPFWEALAGRTRKGEDLDYFDSLKSVPPWPVDYVSW